MIKGCTFLFTSYMCRNSAEETLPKMGSIDRSNQGTLEEQMFYRRRILEELTAMRHGNQPDQVMHQNSNKWYHQSPWYAIRPAWTIHLILVTMKPYCAYICLLIPHPTQMLMLFSLGFCVHCHSYSGSFARKYSMVVHVMW